MRILCASTLCISVVLTVVLGGCKQEDNTKPSSNEPPPLAANEKVVDQCAHGDEKGEPKKTGKSGETIVRGGALPTQEAVALTTVLANPEKFIGKKHVIAGHVRAACTKKGCWMEIAENADKGLQGARVVFRDYSFFVPKDSAGAKAKLYGEVQLTRVSKEQVAHYAAEGASFSKIYSDGTAREIRIIADGVELVRL